MSTSERDSNLDLRSEIDTLRDIVAGTAHATGDEFFRTLVRRLAATLGVSYAFVAQFAGCGIRSRVRTQAFWAKDKFSENVEWDLPGTPCEDVINGKLCHHPSNVARDFPQDEVLREMGISSYLGIPLRNSSGEIIGHMAVFDERPMPSEPTKLLTFEIFAARAAAELERIAALKALQENEQRFRDFYDEAPIAYVIEDLESRFISANRAALRILGITPDQVAGTVGMSFIPDTPDAQRRVKEAFESIGRGTDTAGVVLELRRRDNGKPIFIQWWSKPDPNGLYTRTMFIDITEKVLVEQERNRLNDQNRYLQEEIKSVHNFEEILGNSPTLVEALQSVRRVAKTDTTVLITGETGTGKELFARAIHSASKRHDKPLIKLNCAALPSSLVESELFGHEKGAFSGAIHRRVGRFELAQGGTIFLDEIGEVPPEVQVKLLRVLQEREFERVGGSESIKIDVRVIAATNRDLPKAIREGKFREDLFYRLNVFPIKLPPLRQRAGDVPLLVQYFVQKFGSQIGTRIDTIDAATMERLTSYHWPGNIRELENVIERAVILSNSSVLAIDADVFGTVSRDAPTENRAAANEYSMPPKESTIQTPSNIGTGDGLESLEHHERNHIVRVLRQTKGVIDGAKGAAKILNLKPNTLRSRMKKLGITRESLDSR